MDEMDLCDEPTGLFVKKRNGADGKRENVFHFRWRRLKVQKANRLESELRPIGCKRLFKVVRRGFCRRHANKFVLRHCPEQAAKRSCFIRWWGSAQNGVKKQRCLLDEICTKNEFILWKTKRGCVREGLQNDTVRRSVFDCEANSVFKQSRLVNKRRGMARPNPRPSGLIGGWRRKPGNGTVVPGNVVRDEKCNVFRNGFGFKSGTLKSPTGSTWSAKAGTERTKAKRKRRVFMERVAMARMTLSIQEMRCAIARLGKRAVPHVFGKDP